MAPEKIKIVCRVRPFLEDEGQDDLLAIDGTNITVANQRNESKPHKFCFSSCYPPQAPQQEIFEHDVRPLVERVFEGYDATVFAYGVTGSGKTYTMGGTLRDPGIIPRVAKFLFETKEASRDSNIQITMSYMEILKETVYDLLSPSDKKNASGLDIREDVNRDVFVANLAEMPIQSYGQFTTLYTAASKHRSTASTKLNVHSSRSHAILSLKVTTRSPGASSVSSVDSGDELITSGKINLIDLAGSEDNRKSGNAKDRMTESAAINKSLFVLGQVVEALNAGSIRIPFRDSKMTRILQTTLGGNALGMMIINIAPGYKYITDTIHTLNFGHKSRDISSRARTNIRKTKAAATTEAAFAYPSPSREHYLSDTTASTMRSLKRKTDSFESELESPIAQKQRRRPNTPSRGPMDATPPRMLTYQSITESHHQERQRQHLSFRSTFFDSPNTPKQCCSQTDKRLQEVESRLEDLSHTVNAIVKIMELEGRHLITK